MPTHSKPRVGKFRAVKSLEETLDGPLQDVLQFPRHHILALEFAGHYTATLACRHRTIGDKGPCAECIALAEKGIESVVSAILKPGVQRGKSSTKERQKSGRSRGRQPGQ